MGIIIDILLAIVLGVMPIFCDPMAYKLKVKTNNIPTIIDRIKNRVFGMFSNSKKFMFDVLFNNDKRPAVK